ncbi:major facilitator superfamily domain-containing protein [Mortierella sp. GBAus27b]|nr:major facilitator superfamily domain-containing protein [Mortierella sp. GBAus27b]
MSSPAQMCSSAPEAALSSSTIEVVGSDGVNLDAPTTSSPQSPTSTPPTSESTTSTPPTSFFGTLSEGGVKGWLAVLGSFLIHSLVFAPTEFVFGVFVLHYQQVFQGSQASAIAFVGTTGSAITYIAGFLSGIIGDRFGYRQTAFAGSVIMTASLVLASFSNQLWHLYLSQGILFGIGASLAYYPAIAVPSQYFVKNRGLAIGIAVSGTGMGGFVLAPLTNALVDWVDIFWTLRILAIIIFVVCGGASMLIAEKKVDPKQLSIHLEEEQARQDQERTITGDLEKASELASIDDIEVNAKSSGKEPSFFQALYVFKNPQFLSLTIAEFGASIGYLIPLYYMQTYAVHIGLSVDEGAMILGLSNASSFVGRILLGVIADRVSNTKTLLFCCWGCVVSIMVFWTFANSFGMLTLMGMTFCLFIGAYVSLVPVAVAESFGTDAMASMIGLMYAAGGLAMWGGSPLAGYILDMTRPNLTYTPVIMTAGASLHFLTPHQLRLSPALSTRRNDIMASNNELLVAACREDNLDTLDEVLSSDHASFDVNRKDGLGNTPLHIAAQYGSVGCLEVLTFYDGIKLNIANNAEGDTPLHKAAGYKDPEVALEMVQYLIDKGASPGIKNKLQQTPADVAPQSTHQDVKECLEKAAVAAQFVSVDPRDIAGDDDEESDGEPSDDE